MNGHSSTVSSSGSTIVLVHLKLWPGRKAADITVRSANSELAGAVLSYASTAIR